MPTLNPRHKIGRRSGAPLIRILMLGTALFSAHLQAASVSGPAPDILSDTWLNTAPQKISGLRGKAVLVEFWTFGCWNCRNVEPYIKQWHARYKDAGLEIISVHAPEFDNERNPDNVRNYVAKAGIKYAVAIDNDFANWNRYHNRYWPTLYLVDKRGELRYIKIGEGDYAQTEEKIRGLLREPSP